ncbi:MAG: hypothetical protein LBD81_01665, partial [Holosporaceae bacterium]|nr:hypothetical protein [Holosporaceae bacterium]
MRFFYQILVSSVSLAFCTDFANAVVKQTPKIRSMCRDAQDLEKKISKEEESLSVVSLMEKISTPAVKNMYEMLT